MSVTLKNILEVRMSCAKLMDMTVEAFRKEFRSEYDGLYNEKKGEFEKEIQGTPLKLVSLLIERTSWGKAHERIIGKGDGKNADKKAAINTLFFLFLIGATAEKKKWSFNDNLFDYLYKTSNVFNRVKGILDENADENKSIKKLNKLQDGMSNSDHSVKEYAYKFALEYQKIMSNQTDEIDENKLEEKYKELVDKYKIDNTEGMNVIKIFTGNENEKSYLEKLEEERNKMSRTYKTIKDEIIENIKAGVKQIILTGAPGTGKSKMAKEIAQDLGAVITADKKNYIMVQFHPSYDYTDFVEGIRPVEEQDKEGIGFRKVNGVFKQFCQQVVKKNEEEKNEEKKYFFIIDEINRADLSKVFGELMYCLESDKRGNENMIATQYQNMKTYENKEITDKEGEIKNYKIALSVDDKFEAGFYIPKNVYIIGTMNDIDRSVESMDFALRRRFMWKEIEVSKELIEETLQAMLAVYFLEYGVDKSKILSVELAGLLAPKVVELNEKIKVEGVNYGLNKHYFISQGQFTDLSKDIFFEKVDSGDKASTKLKSNEMICRDICQYVWDNRLKSLLFEYVRGEDNAEDFVAACATAFEVK